MAERSGVYLKAFEKLDCRDRGDLVYPAYYLLAHSCELALKAYLSAKGWSGSQVVQLNHRLPKMLAKAREEGLPEISLLDELVSSLTDANEDHLLRYPGAFYLKSVPEPQECAAVVADLLAKIRPTVTHAFLTSLAAETQKGP